MPVKHHAKLACQDADEVVDSYNRFINEDCRKFVEFEVIRAQEDSKLTNSKNIKHYHDGPEGEISMQKITNGTHDEFDLGSMISWEK